MLNNDKCLVRINLSDIAYIEADRMYCHLHMVDGRTTHTLSHPLRHIEQELPSDTFVRIHRSLVVNIWHIARVMPADVILDCASKPLPIGESFKESLYQHFWIINKPS